MYSDESSPYFVHWIVFIRSQLDHFLTEIDPSRFVYLYENRVVFSVHIHKYSSDCIGKHLYFSTYFSQHYYCVTKLFCKLVELFLTEFRKPQNKEYCSYWLFGQNYLTTDASCMGLG